MSIKRYFADGKNSKKELIAASCGFDDGDLDARVEALEGDWDDFIRMV